MRIWVLSLLLLSSTVIWAAAGEYYRYTDVNGNMVIDNDIPPELIKNGYDVIDKHGRMIRSIKAQATEEQLIAVTAERKKQQEEEAKLRAQAIYDLSLLRRYSFVSDIEAEKTRKIKEMEISVSILKGNLIGVRSELALELEKAAQIERAGRKLTETQQERIATLEKKITTTEDMLNKRRAARDITGLEYQRSIERFKELQIMRGRKP